MRKVEKSRFAEEAQLILGILNDAWSDNWGFVRLTAAEIAYVSKKLKPNNMGMGEEEESDTQRRTRRGRRAA